MNARTNAVLVTWLCGLGGCGPLPMEPDGAEIDRPAVVVDAGMPEEPRPPDDAGTFADPLPTYEPLAEREAPLGVKVARRYVFVTHAAWTGNLGGVAGADAKCSAAAAAAKLPGSWQSILIGSGQTLAQRVPQGGPWYRVDGQLAFLDKAELLSAPRVPLTLDEHGAPVTGYGNAWTGVIKYGGIAGSNCSGWTSANGGSDGKAGRVSATFSDWIDQNGAGCSTSDCGPRCSTLLHLYCLQR